ncbi:Serine/threonine-protein kinase Sgk1 [Homalodisca vitripennis]|nr:Serine/threonine-protein kinase Sgk1 [Homalodisca vitripennis]
MLYTIASDTMWRTIAVREAAARELIRAAGARAPKQYDPQWVNENFRKRMQQCVDDEGRHLPDTLFKTILVCVSVSREEVRTFLQLDGHCQTTEEPSTEDTCEKAEEDENLNLGPSERTYAKPGDFEFLHVIGKGSFGKVLLARHRHDNVYYAVKVLSKRLIVRQNEAQHIMSERNVLMKNLHHPFLVGLHFSFQTSDKLFFVLDYVNGGELFFHLQRERTFTEPRARFYAAEIASALGYLHSQGIIYRDLKPENLLLDSVGHVVLTDFGLSKEGLLATDTTNTFCGTPEYLAPEVVRKEAYDRSVDWWCLGAVLYEMLYGLPPFYSRNTAEMYAQILYQPLRLRVGPTEPAKRILTEVHKVQYLI